MGLRFLAGRVVGVSACSRSLWFARIVGQARDSHRQMFANHFKLNPCHQLCIHQQGKVTANFPLRIQHPTGGKTPRNFGIDPSGAYLLAENQDSGTIVVLRIDPKTGKLAPTGHEIEVPMPVCAKFMIVE